MKFKTNELANVPNQKIELPTGLSDSETTDLLSAIARGSPKPPVLALVTPPLNDKYAPAIQRPENVDDQVYIRVSKLCLPNYFYKPEYKSLSLIDLREKGKSIKVEYTDDDIAFIENNTKTTNWYWQRLRVGRVTATTFKKVCCTSIDKPAISYLKQICWPELCSFTSTATEFGKKNEPIAVKRFCDEMCIKHKNFSYRKIGIVVNKKYPFFSATPDGIVNCDCCGVSLLEVKCPWTLNKAPTSLQDFSKIKNSFLIFENNDFQLSKKHEYYFQVQMQMALLEYNFCYFYVWGKNEQCVIKIDRDTSFWETNSIKAMSFVKNVIIPELMGNYFTKNTEQQT